MFSDIVEITSFTFELLEADKIQKKNAKKVYDTYRTLYDLVQQAELVTSYLSREIDNSHDIRTSFGTQRKKWLFFSNKEIYKYENLKYRLFCYLSSLDSDAMFDGGILSKNFFSKSINCKIDEYTQITKVDDELGLEIYSFNLLKENCPPMRGHDELFTSSVVDLNIDNNRQIVIEKAKEDRLLLMEILEKFKQYMVNKYTITDLV